MDLTLTLSSPPRLPQFSRGLARLWPQNRRRTAFGPLMNSFYFHRTAPTETVLSTGVVSYENREFSSRPTNARPHSLNPFGPELAKTCANVAVGEYNGVRKSNRSGASDIATVFNRTRRTTGDDE